MNEIITNFWGRPISLLSSTYNKITDNIISTSYCKFFHDCSSIYLHSSSHNSIVNNDISNGTGGIHLDSSSYNKITDNNISSNINNDGIKLLSSHNNEITNNIVSHNTWYSISLSGSSNNRIFHNNFIEHYYQAQDNRDNNFWNNTYPSGGNYWSDHSPTCVDNYSGPVTPQTSGAPDGICDIQ